MEKYTCECGKVYELDDEKAKWTFQVTCECGNKAIGEKKPVITNVPITKV